jgi:hypothetical protein
MSNYLDWINEFNSANIDKEVYKEYSAKSVTNKLTGLLNELP